MAVDTVDNLSVDTVDKIKKNKVIHRLKIKLSTGENLINSTNVKKLSTELSTEKGQLFDV